MVMLINVMMTTANMASKSKMMRILTKDMMKLRR